MSTPGKRDFTIYQAAKETVRIEYYDSNDAPVNLTGYTARCKIRDREDSPGVRIDLSTSNGGISLGGAAGTIDLLFTTSNTATITKGQYVYDIQLIDGSANALPPLVEGTITVDAAISRT